METERNKELARRWFEEIWTNNRAETIDELMDPECIVHGLGEGAMQGPAGYKAFYQALISAIPDIRIEVEDAIAEGDRTALRFTATGTHTGPGLPVEPAGAKVEVTGMTFGRWRDGKIVEGWNNVDMPALMRQIGSA